MGKYIIILRRKSVRMSLVVLFSPTEHLNENTERFSLGIKSSNVTVRNAQYMRSGVIGEEMYLHCGCGLVERREDR